MFDARSVLHHCHLNALPLEAIHAELQDSGVFRQVLYASDDADYQLLVTTAAYNHEDGAELGSAVVAGATLMLAPMKVSTEVKVDAVLTWNGQLVKRMAFDLPFEMQASLLNMNQDADRDLAKSIVSHLIASLHQAQAFSAQTLVDLLHASDYSADMKVPEVVGEFQIDDTFVYRHPLRGSQIRFIHREFQFDRLDLFVYPVRDWRLENIGGVLKKEADNVRQDMRLAEKKGIYQQLQLDEDRLYPVSAGDSERTVLRFDGTFHNQEEAIDYATRTYLVVMKDKFVKVRASFGKTSATLPDTDTVVAQLVRELTVPDESLFMVELRKHWRDTNDL